jgi:hypothetical protein
MTTTTRLDVKQTAALVRAALRAGWPGITFSVRARSSKGYTTIDVSWEDGPAASAVDEVARRYEGTAYDEMTGGERREPTLIAFNGEELPKLVTFSCQDVGLNRRIGPKGWAAVVEILNSAQPGVAVLNNAGTALNDARLTMEVAERLDVLPGLDVDIAAWRLFCRLDFTI